MGLKPAGPVGDERCSEPPAVTRQAQALAVLHARCWRPPCSSFCLVHVETEERLRVAEQEQWRGLLAPVKLGLRWVLLSMFVMHACTLSGLETGHGLGFAVLVVHHWTFVGGLQAVHGIGLCFVKAKTVFGVPGLASRCSLRS